MTYGKLVVLPGAAGLPGCCRGAAGCCRVLPGVAGYLLKYLPSRRLSWSVLPGCCRVTAGLQPGCCRVAGLLPGYCRVAGLPGAAGLSGCCRVVAGLGCRVAGARAQIVTRRRCWFFLSNTLYQKLHSQNKTQKSLRACIYALPFQLPPPPSLFIFSMGIYFRRHYVRM